MKTSKNPRKSFGEHEWAFHKIPQDQLLVAWVWELERTLTAGSAPWLVSGQAGQQFLVTLSNPKLLPLVLEYSLEHARPDFVGSLSEAWRASPYSYRKLHLLDIDWSESKTNILDELTGWFKKHWDAVPTKSRRIQKGGRKNQFLAWFVDLAIYRASEAGLSRLEAVKILRPLFVATTGSVGSKATPSHWEDAQRRTRERLRQRALDRNSSILGETAPEEWKRMYVPDWLR